MKKLTFALACASALSIFAQEAVSWENTTGFENYSLTDGSFAGLSGQTDAGGDPSDGSAYWLFEDTNGAEDGSAVKAYGGEGPEAVTAPTAEGSYGSQYLEVSTEGGTLWRSVNPLNFDTTPDFGEPKEVGEGLYIDTMVQFTVTEGNLQDAPALNAETDKLAIWLNKDESNNEATPQLMVRAAHDKVDSTTPVNYVLTVEGQKSFAVDPNTWHRLTVKTIEYYTGFRGFLIYLDGQLLVSAGDNPLGVSSSDGSTLAWDSSNASVNKKAVAKAIFPGLNNAFTALQGVGVRGTGKLDNLMITATDPLPEAPADDISFTIIIGENDWTDLEWSTNGSDWNKYVPESAKAQPGKTVSVRFTNADDITKVVEFASLSDQNNSFNVSSETFTWGDYLGSEAYDGLDNFWKLSNEDDLELFRKGAKTLGTQGVTFKLTADIALTAPWAGVASFSGTFDGQNHTISNVEFANVEGDSANNYRGFFNNLSGATVKNLTVDGIGFEKGTTGSYGGAMIAGKVAGGSTIEGCTSKGAFSGTHNVAGIAVKITDSTVKNCTNYATVEAAYTKVGGIVAFEQSSKAATPGLIEGCVNNGRVTLIANTKCSKNMPELKGAGGIVAWAGNKLVIKDCSNGGQITTSGEWDAAHVNSYGLGQVIAWEDGGSTTLQGTNTGLATGLAIGTGTFDGLNYATVDGNVATYVADAAVVAGEELLVTAKGLAPELELGEDETITFNMALATIDENGITAAEGRDLVRTPDTGLAENDCVTFSTKAKAVEPEEPVAVNATFALTVNGDAAVKYVSGTDKFALPASGTIADIDTNKYFAVLITPPADKWYTITLTIDEAEQKLVASEGDFCFEIEKGTWNQYGFSAEVATVNATLTITEVTPPGPEAGDIDDAIVEAIEPLVTGGKFVGGEGTHVNLEGRKAAIRQAIKCGISPTVLSQMNFDGESEGEVALAEKAFLLDCEATQAAVDAKIATFKVTAITQDPEGKWTVSGATINGNPADTEISSLAEVVTTASTTVNGEYNTDNVTPQPDETMKFFKAVIKLKEFGQEN